jgi:hypothetical protein
LPSGEVDISMPLDAKLRSPIVEVGSISR